MTADPQTGAAHKPPLKFPEPSADEPKAPEARYRPDDDELAIAIAREFGDRTGYMYQTWREYTDEGAWEERSVSEVRLRIRKFLRGWRDHGVQVTTNRIRALTSMLEDDLSVPDRALLALADEQAKYINLRNGLLNLATMKLESHRRDLYFTSRLDFDYDEDADCPNFRRFLNSSLVLPDSEETDWKLVTLVQEALGYSLTARTDLKASFWCVGARDSGKSTLMAMIKGLMGSLHTTIDLTQLGDNRFLLGCLVGKRVATFTESNSNTLLPDAIYKTLVGGSDDLYVDVKNRDPIVFRPIVKIWWGMNFGSIPRISDRSGATTRRIHFIPFNRTIPERKRKGNLEALLLSERPGILNALITHYLRLTRAGGEFERCPQSEAMRQEYILKNDTEQTYLNDRAVLTANERVSSSALYADYRAWCDVNGFKPKTINQIADEWKRLGLRHYMSNGRAFWQGLKLNPDSTS